MPLNFLNNGYFAGTVGIGTVSADYKLDIGGTVASTDNTARLMQNNGGTAIRIGSGGGSSDVVLLRIDGNSVTGGHDGATDSSNYGFSFKYFGSGGGNNNRFGILSDNQVAATQVEAITILQDGFIGIGNTAPGYKLDVTGSVQSYISATRYIRLQGASADFEVVSDNNTKPVSRITGTGTADLFQIFDNTTEVFTVLDGGNVGIGDTGPNVKLQVSTSSPTNNVAVSIGDGWVGNSSYHKEGGLLLISGTSQDATQTGAGIAFQTRNTQNTNYWKSSMIMDRDGAIRFTLGGAGTVAGSEDFTILSGGNVGIGVTSPAAKLHIADTNKAINTEGNLFVATTDAYAIDKGGQISLGGVWHSTPLTIEFAAIAGRKQTAVNGNAGGYLQLSTSNSSGGNLTEKMRITSAGGISFGTTGTAYGTSGQILKSNGNASPTWIDGSAIPGVPAGSGTTNYLARWTPDGDTLGNSIVFDNGTNVGIGTSSVGTYKLNVDGAIRIGVSGTIQPLLSRDSSTGGLIVSSVGNSGDFIFQGTGGSEKFRIKDTGNVGIGTDSPLGKLQVNEYTVASQGNQNVHGELSVFTNSGDESLFLGIKNAAYPNRGWAFNPVTSGVNSDLQIKEHGASGVRMVIESGGNVGIGVTDPTEKLHLQSTTSGCFVRFADQTASGVYVGSRNDELEIYAGNAERMGIDATGVVRFNAYGTGILQTDTNGVISVNLSPLVDGITFNNGASITNQINTDVDTGTETVANVAIATYTAAFFDFVIKKTTNVRSGTVYACHDGTNVEFTETSTQDLGDTSDVTLSVDISGTDMRLRATTTSDDWSVKSLIRAI